MCCPGAAKSFKPARLGRWGREARWALSVSAVADMMVYPAPQTPWAACPVHIFSIVLLCPPRPCDPTHNTAGRGGLIYWLSYSKYHHFLQHLSLWARHSELQPKQGEKGHSSPSVNTIQTCDGTSNKILLKMIPSVELPLRKNPRITRWTSSSIHHCCLWPMPNTSEKRPSLTQIPANEWTRRNVFLTVPGIWPTIHL